VDGSSYIRVTFNVTRVNTEGLVIRGKDFPKSWEAWGHKKIKETPDFEHKPIPRIKVDSLTSVLAFHKALNLLTPEVHAALTAKQVEETSEHSIVRDEIVHNALKIIRLQEDARLAKAEARESRIGCVMVARAVGFCGYARCRHPSLFSRSPLLNLCY
jgi:hypothetical protein